MKPTGLPPESSRSRVTKVNSPIGPVNAVCDGGEITSAPSGTPRISAISGVNSNHLAGDGTENIETLSGMSHLSGIPIELRRVE